MRIERLRRLAMLALALALAIPRAGSAQIQTGSLFGQVTDEQGVLTSDDERKGDQ